MLEYYPFFLELNKNFNLRNNPNNIFSHNPANTQQFIYYAILVFIIIIMFSFLFMWYIYIRLNRHQTQEENNQEENNESTDQVRANIEMQNFNSNNIAFIPVNSPIKIDNNNNLSSEFDSEKTNDSSQERKIVSCPKMKDNNISPFSKTVNDNDQKVEEVVNKNKSKIFI